MSDKIAEIHARRQRGMKGLTQTHHDRATLLAEDARHRAEIERLRVEVDTATRERDEARAEVTRMQELLRGISINMVDLIEQLTRERDAARAENDRLRAEIERLRASLKQFRCSCDPGECVEYGERWASVCEKGEARDVLEARP